MKEDQHLGETVLVTGAAGLIGQAVIVELLRRGYRVRAMTHHDRDLPKHPMLSIVSGDITDAAFVERVMTGATYVVHLAARKADEKDSMHVNEGGAKVLGAAAKAAQVRRVMNISTQSVKLPRHGIYARSKAAADRALQSYGIPMTTLRLSVVYSDAHHGILGSLIGYATLPIVPVIGNGKAVFWPIHRDDAARAIAELMTNTNAEGKTYDAGGPEAWSFDALLSACAKGIGKDRIRLLHIPIPVAMCVAKILMMLPRPPITVSNVLGSAAIVTMDPTPFFRDIGFTPRGMREGLSALFSESAMRNREAVALLRYVLPDAGPQFPDDDTRDRYLHALRVYGIADHTLDLAVMDSPFLLGMIDAVAAIRNKHAILRRKLLIAAAIAECTPDSASTLLPQDRSWMTVILICLMAGYHAGTRLFLGMILSLLAPSFTRRNAGC